MRFNPTVALAAAVFLLFATCLTITSVQPPGSWTTLLLLLPVQFIAIILAYTVAHDAVHRVASRNRNLNELMLFGAGVIFLFNPILYRRLHLTHHAHPHSQHDPDRFTHSTTIVARAARSAVLPLAYYLFALRTLGLQPRWRKHLALGLLIPIVPAACFAWAGRLDIFVILWILPLLLTTALLGLFLSSLPHDHELDQTHNLNLPRPLCWLLGNGHLHLAHHTFARVPWYRLPGVWREYQQSILSNDPSSRVGTCR